MSVALKTKKPAIVNYLRHVNFAHRTFTWSDVPVSDSTFSHYKAWAFTLPANCFPLETYIMIPSSFDKDVIIGTSASNSSTAILSTAEIQTSAGTTGAFVLDKYMGTYSTSDVPVYVNFKTTGATKGSMEIWQAFLPVYPTT